MSVAETTACAPQPLAVMPQWAVTGGTADLEETTTEHGVTPPSPSSGTDDGLDAIGSTSDPDPSTGTGSRVEPPECETHDYYLCEDFEQAEVDGPPGEGWTTKTREGASLEVSSSMAFSGQRSMHFEIPQNADAHPGAVIVRAAPEFPMEDNAMYGRMMVWASGFPDGIGNWSSVKATGAPGFWSFGGIRGTMWASRQPDHCGHTTDTEFPIGRWSCIQWQFDGPAQELRIWVDEQLDEGMTVTPALNPCPDKGPYVAPIFEALELGWWGYQPTDQPIDLWIDDVALDSTLVPCPEEPDPS